MNKLFNYGIRIPLRGHTRYALTALMAAISAVVVLLPAVVVLPHRFVSPPVLAQNIRSDGVWRAVYERIPDLPLENQYISRETGQVATDNTLVGRFIRYHLYVKGRPPFYRLDWKLTMADYLGLKGTLDESTYPSAATLRKNPMEADVAAINKLNRAQRDALVQALVDAFTPTRK